MRIFRNIVKTLGMLVVVTVLFSGCSKNDDDTPDIPANPGLTGELEKAEEYNLNVTEPSGLCFGRDGQTLFTVSDNSNKVYELDLQGNVIRELPYTGEDLEGVTYNPVDDVLAIVEERSRQVVILNYEQGDELKRYDIDVKVIELNKGLEGISWNNNNRAYYLLNENSPALLMVWKPETGIISKVDLNFAADYSGIFVDSKNGSLWVVSDESQTLYRCDYSMKVLEKFELNFSKAEGIAVDFDNNKVYVVSDRLSKLFVYKIVK